MNSCEALSTLTIWWYPEASAPRLELRCHELPLALELDSALPECGPYSWQCVS